MLALSFFGRMAWRGGADRRCWLELAPVHRLFPLSEYVEAMRVLGWGHLSASITPAGAGGLQGKRWFVQGRETGKTTGAQSRCCGHSIGAL